MKLGLIYVITKKKFIIGNLTKSPSSSGYDFAT